MTSTPEMARAFASVSEQIKRDNADYNVNVKDVIDQLEALGYDPVEMLVKARKGKKLNEFQKVAIDKELLKYMHAQKKAVDVTATHKGEIVVTISEKESKL